MKTWQYLGYLGLIPFVFCLYLSGKNTLWQSDAQQAFIAYSAIILSFIAGSLWQIENKALQTQRQIVANIFSLLAFSALLIEAVIALTLLALGYLLIYAYETRLIKNNRVNTGYVRMRTTLTVYVILMHIFAFYLWFG